MGYEKGCCWEKERGRRRQANYQGATTSDKGRQGASLGKTSFPSSNQGDQIMVIDNRWTEKHIRGGIVATGPAEAREHILNLTSLNNTRQGDERHLLTLMMMLCLFFVFCCARLLVAKTKCGGCGSGGASNEQHTTTTTDGGLER